MLAGEEIRDGSRRKHGLINLCAEIVRGLLAVGLLGGLTGFQTRGERTNMPD